MGVGRHRESVRRTEVVCRHHDPIFVLDGEDGRASDNRLSERMNRSETQGTFGEDALCVLRGTIRR